MDVPAPGWRFPPDRLILSCDEVHVWRTTPGRPTVCVESLEQTLTADERKRAEQFRFSKDRMHFIVTRGLLRAILGRYLATDPRTLQFCYSPYGKPGLTGDDGNNGLFFNVTHSHGMALFAVTRNREVGVDLEYIDAHVACEQIAERFFSPYEVGMLRGVPQQMRSGAFFCCWARKEAYLKARGVGLSFGLSQFDVSVTPGTPAALLNTREENQDISCWSLYDLSPGSGYVAALAAKGHPERLQCWQWSEEEPSKFTARRL